MGLYFGMPIWPGYYSWSLLKQVGISSPPVLVDPLAEYLNLKVRHFSGSEHFGAPSKEQKAPSPPKPPADVLLFDDRPYRRKRRAGRSRRGHTVIDGVLRKDSRTVWLNADNPETRQRITFGHEIGHLLLPGHKDLNSLYDGCLVNPSRRDPHEQEATTFGAHLLMPPCWFFEDVHSIELGLHAVDLLACHYLTSLEATAIQYVRLNLHPCALIMAEPNLEFPEESWDFPLVVRYSVRNRAFQDYIRPGTLLPLRNPSCCDISPGCRPLYLSADQGAQGIRREE